MQRSRYFTPMFFTPMLFHLYQPVDASLRTFFFTPDDDSQSSVIVIQPTDNGANTTHAAPQIETFYDEFQQTVSTSTPLEVMYSDH